MIEGLENGDTLLHAEYSSATLTILKGTPQATADAQIAAFFANDKAPALTRADVLAAWGKVTGVPPATLSALLDGSLK